MSIGTIDRTPPPFFRQGLSALTKLILFAALALFLMVADTRFTITKQLRDVVDNYNAVESGMQTLAKLAAIVEGAQ